VLAALRQPGVFRGTAGRTCQWPLGPRCALIDRKRITAEGAPNLKAATTAFLAGQREESHPAVREHPGHPDAARWHLSDYA
jgi:hypothetical protein